MPCAEVVAKHDRIARLVPNSAVQRIGDNDGMLECCIPGLVPSIGWRGEVCVARDRASSAACQRDARFGNRAGIAVRLARWPAAEKSGCGSLLRGKVVCVVCLGRVSAFLSRQAHALTNLQIYGTRLGCRLGNAQLQRVQMMMTTAGVAGGGKGS